MTIERLETRIEKLDDKIEALQVGQARVDQFHVDMNRTLDKILDQTTKTNGRTTENEKAIENIRGRAAGIAIAVSSGVSIIALVLHAAGVFV